MIQLLLAVIYLSFISLGLPDALLGSAWPTMYQQFDVPISYAGIVSFIIAAGTVVSSLQSDRLTKKLGAGKVTACSVAMTAVALLGFSFSSQYWMLLLWAVPYGLGAGSVDACLNNYVALHYESRHMSWLHCMWGVGAAIGPYIMGYALSHRQETVVAYGYAWNTGYRYVGMIQIALTMILFMSLPLWKRSDESTDGVQPKSLSLKEVVAIPGAKSVMVAFFCYCAMESTVGLWASSYLVLEKGIAEEIAAKFASLFFVGITIGRAVSGFITMKMNDKNMIRMGCGIILLGVGMLLFPLGDTVALAGLIVVGIGCAPVYPCIIHSTPIHFGADKSQCLIGVQMASAYVGSCLMPPLFGLLANHITVALYPFYILALVVGLIIMHENLCKVCGD